jgi:hypothetical protein
MDQLYLPYHLASSSLSGETATGLDLGGGAAFFLEKSATVLKVAGLEGVGADLAAPLKLRGFPSISDTPREAAAVDAAREAISANSPED